MVPLAAQIDRYRLRETEAALGIALEALLGYAAAHDNRLPCPDIDGDGTEDRPGPTSAPCRGIEGELPRATLGVPGRDGWGRPLRYRGNDALTGPGGIPRPPNTRAPSDRQPAHRRTPDRRRSGSAGRNPCSRAARTPSGRRERRHGREPRRVHQPPAPRPRYAHAVPGRPGSGGFDDVLVWMSKNVLLGRLIRAAPGREWSTNHGSAGGDAGGPVLQVATTCMKRRKPPRRGRRSHARKESRRIHAHRNRHRARRRRIARRRGPHRPGAHRERKGSAISRTRAPGSDPRTSLSSIATAGSPATGTPPKPAKRSASP